MTNHLEEEINKFNSYGESWWDLSGPAKGLHDMIPGRLKFITSLMSLEGKKGIDIGCGGGLMTEALAKGGAHMSGLDLAPESINVAKRHSKLSNLDIAYICEDVEGFAEKSHGEFDFAVCLEMLEHTPEPQKIIAAASKLVKPGGIVILSTIDRSYLSWFSMIFLGEYIFRMLPVGTHQYGLLIKKSELSEWADKSSLKLLDQKNLTYNPLNQKYDISGGISTTIFISGFTK